jgi:YbgC/YbaW family acyl-CoA thioester hydrolase
LPETPKALTEHRLTRRVQFHETDAAGLVHFSCFFRYLEEAEHALWRAAGLSIHPPGSDIGWPRLATSFEFHQSLRFEEEFEVCIRVVEMGKHTIRYTCHLTRGDARIATGSLTIICVSKRDNEPMKAVPIPAAVAARLSPAPAAEPLR